MISAIPGFDRHPSISYLPTRKPYWGTFPYRVTCLLPSSVANRHRSCLRALAKKRAELLNEMIYPDGDCPHKGWLAAGLAFYFKTAREASDFIDANVERIHDVHRPVEGQEELLQDPKIRVQKNLYWMQYRYKLTFNVRTYLRDDQQVAELDDWALTEFPGDEDGGRGLYSISDVRTLYLRDERDILLVQIMVGPYLKDIEKVVLISELTN